MVEDLTRRQLQGFRGRAWVGDGWRHAEGPARRRNRGRSGHHHARRLGAHSRWSCGPRWTGLGAGCAHWGWKPVIASPSWCPMVPRWPSPSWPRPAPAAFAPLNPKYRSEELRFYLDDLGAKALITRPDESGSDARDTARAADAGVLPVALTGSAADGVGSIDMLASSPAAEPSAPNGPSPDDVALVLHTSGTTSRPKIVPLRQRHLTRSASGIAQSLDLTAADRSLQVMPLFHIHGPAGRAAGTTVRGGSGCLHRGLRRLPVLRPARSAAPHVLHRGADHAPDGDLPLVPPPRYGPGRGSSVRALIVGVAARAGADRARGAVRLARDRGLRHDRGNSPDVRQPPAACGGQAAVGGGSHRHRTGRARLAGPDGCLRGSGARCRSRARR